MGITPMAYELKVVSTKTKGSQPRLSSKPLSWLFFKYEKVAMERQDMMIIEDETVNKTFRESLHRMMLDQLICP
jgi:hypothetical protein